MSARRVTVRAPAKLNLTLAVRGRRPDGFHELDSLMMALELGDVLTVEAGGGECTLALSGPAAPGVPADGTNLALRAARAVQALAARRGRAPSGVHLSLAKYIPAQAGLGGGSADAAAAAYACALLLDVDPDDPELRENLGELGSDCAFFLAARSTGLARCTGRGERVELLPPLALPWSLALVTPSFGCSTAAVYAAFDERTPRQRPPSNPHSAGSLAGARALFFNELEPAAERACRELRPFREVLECVAPGAFRLAGSGSSWFGFFEDEPSARDALARLAVELRGRRYGLRGQWVLPARSRGMEVVPSRLH